MYKTVQVIRHDTTQPRAGNVAICIVFYAQDTKQKALKISCIFLKSAQHLDVDEGMLDSSQKDADHVSTNSKSRYSFPDPSS
jgi:hypothetical protein